MDLRSSALRGSAVLVLVAGVGAAALLLLGPDQEADESPSLQFGNRRYENVEGGYEFLYPREWHLTAAGTRTKVVSPERDVVVSIGLAPPGGLGAASDAFVASVREAYDDVETTSTERDRIAGNAAVFVGGSAVTNEGEPIRFLTVTVGDSGRNYAIGVFVPGAAEPTEVLPTVRGMIDSFRPSHSV